MENTPIGIVVPVRNGWALFLSGGELSLVGSCPRTRIRHVWSRVKEDKLNFITMKIIYLMV